jgi:hypothetical protein
MLHLPPDVCRSRRAVIGADKRRLPSAANRGIRVGDLLLKSKDTGEFAGLCLQALAASPRLWLLEDVLTIAEQRLSGMPPEEAAQKLHYSDVLTVDAAIGYYLSVVCKQKDIPPLFLTSLEQQSGQLSASTRHFLQLRRSDPLQIPFILLTGPPWMEPLLGQRFENGTAFHQTLDTLPHRVGQPATRFAAIHSCTVRSADSWASGPEITGRICATQTRVDTILWIQVGLEHTVSRVTAMTSNLPDDYRYALLPTLNRQVKGVQHTALLLAFSTTPDYVPAPRGSSPLTTGLAQSLLQKAIRRRSHSAASQAVEALMHAPTIHRPDLRFAACSGTRQLIWRLVICALEDVRPFSGIASLMELALVAHFDPSFRLSAPMYEQLRTLAVKLCDVPTRWDWKHWSMVHSKRGRRQKEPHPDADTLLRCMGTHPVKPSVLCAFYHMPCLAADLQLLLALLQAPPQEILPELDSVPVFRPRHPQQLHEAALLAACDNHSNPFILLQVQAEHHQIPSPLSTTLQVAKVMWDHSSSINLRLGRKVCPAALQPLLATIQAVQAQLPPAFTPLQTQWPLPVGVYPLPPLSPMERREAFLSLFGETRRYQSVRVTLCGTVESPFLVQAGAGVDPFSFLTGEKQQEGEKRFLEEAGRGFVVQLPPAPLGRAWKMTGSSVTVTVMEGYHCAVNGLECPLFDAEPLLDQSQTGLRILSLSDLPALNCYVHEALYLAPAIHHGHLCSTLIAAADSLKVDAHTVWSWLQVACESPLSQSVWRDLLCKLRMYDRQGGYVDVHPVDRRGKSQDKAVSYQTEGTMLRLLSLLCVLYPHLLRASGRSRFRLNTTSPTYFHLMDTLDQLLVRPPRFYNPHLPRMNWNGGHGFAWDHQRNTAQRVLQEHAQQKFNFAVASHIGSGKTGTALNVATARLEENRKQGRASHGILYLVPTNPLIDGTLDEIKKHTLNYTVLAQQANGSLKVELVPHPPLNQTALDGLVQQSSTDPQLQLDNGHIIVVTTLARMRDHPLNKRWTLVVIDECTSIQNQSALQTAEAWKQVTCSEFGVLMMSATFFRTRFSKLFDLISMLASPIPSRESYLTALLHERIICHIPDKKRQWSVQHQPVPLTPIVRARYDAVLLQSHKSNMTKYAELQAVLQEWDAVSSLVQVTLQLLEAGRKPLLFARTAAEEKALRLKLDSKQKPGATGVTLVTVRRGAFGLNLQHCDAVVTRPQPGDILEQMKGRIDRPGQQRNDLLLLLVYAHDTIEQVDASNLRICDGFVRQYIHPFGEQYQSLALLGEEGAKNLENVWL